MTLTRILPHELRASLLIALGTGFLIAPVWLLLSPAAIVLGLLAGVLSIGIGIAGTAAGGRGTIPLRAHKAYDRTLAAALAHRGAGLRRGRRDGGPCRVRDRRRNAAADRHEHALQRPAH